MKIVLRKTRASEAPRAMTRKKIINSEPRIVDYRTNPSSNPPLDRGGCKIKAMKNGVVVEAKTKRYHLRYRDSLTWAARKNRKKETGCEKIIWNKLLRRKQLGIKFTKQKPIDRFIVDFYCSELCLAVEIDGDSHLVKRGRDILRDKFLRCCGITTLRFSNEDVVNDIDNVKQVIQKFIDDSNAPALSREGVRGRV